MKAKLRGNQCTKCEKTHEACATSSCTQAGISEYVCRMFGTLPISRVKRRK